MKPNDLELLAALENMRLSHPNTFDDYAMRLVCAVVADNCGYKDRNSWIVKLQAAGLVEYKIDRQEERETAKQNYKRLMEKMKS